MPAPSAVARLLGQGREQRGVEEAGGDRDDADAARGQVARRRQRHADDAALRGRVGDLADLAVVGGDRGRVDADAALALLVGLVLAHRGGGEAEHVEGADQVDLDDVGEVLELVGAALAGDPLGPADAGAADRDPQPALGAAARSTAAATASSSVTSASTNSRASSAASASPLSALRSAITTLAPASASARAVAAPSPEAPPATNAPAPSTSIGAGAYD